MENEQQAEGTSISAASLSYPDSSTIFSGTETLEAVRSTCLVVIDTNALLLPYRISPDSLARIRETYANLAKQSRLIIPGQVAREFAKNRTSKIAELYQQISRRRLDIQKGTYPLLEEIPAYKESVQLESEIEKVLAKYRDKLNQVMKTIESWEWNDPVSKMYQEIFGTGGVVLDPSFSKDEVSREFRSRCDMSIPPGYKDAWKEDEGIGDFLIWKTILELGKAQEKSVVLVSGEQKSDWRIKSEGKALYPRYELVDEFKRNSGGHSFHLLQFSDFLDLYGAGSAAVQEVREKEREITLMPGALTQILMVCDEVLVGNRDYSEAVRLVAAELDISDKSVADKCTRKIGIHTQEFRELLQNREALLDHLIDWFPEQEATIRKRLT